MAPSPPFSAALARPTGGAGNGADHEEHNFGSRGRHSSSEHLRSCGRSRPDYIVNGHKASKAEAQFLASYSAPAGQWQVDGYGISRVADEHPAPPIVKTTGRKCWYVLDVQLHQLHHAALFLPEVLHQLA